MPTSRVDHADLFSPWVGATARAMALECDCAPQDSIEARKRSKGLIVRLRPIALIAVLLLLWQFAVTRNPIHLLPTPWGVVTGIGDLLQHGLLLKYVVASLIPRDLGLRSGGCFGCALRAHHRLEPPRRDGPQSLDSDSSPHLPAGLDSASPFSGSASATWRPSFLSFSAAFSPCS